MALHHMYITMCFIFNEPVTKDIMAIWYVEYLQKNKKKKRKARSDSLLRILNQPLNTKRDSYSSVSVVTVTGFESSMPG